jgi:hypothetical protein
LKRNARGFSAEFIFGGNFFGLISQKTESRDIQQITPRRRFRFG